MTYKKGLKFLRNHPTVNSDFVQNSIIVQNIQEYSILNSVFKVQFIVKSFPRKTSEFSQVNILKFIMVLR